jgi:DNA-binding CsgD family transcriptional regulator
MQKPQSYEQYLELLQNSPQLGMNEEGNKIIEQFRSTEYFPSRYAPVVFLLDFTTKKYVYVVEACLQLLGYTASYFLATGLEEYLNKWHPVDFQLINNKVFPENIKFIKTLAPEKYIDIIFSYNYRMRNPKGEYVTVLQRFSYVPSSIRGKPYGMIGVIFDITHFKNDISVIHTIEEVKRHNGDLLHETLFKKVYPINQYSHLSALSKRESEILTWMSQGRSSKQIADTLKISINTVNNHRKNMLLKTISKNSSELLNYAIRHGYL